MLLFFFASSWRETLAQKNMVAVDKAIQSGIRLPDGSKQDKRLLSVSAAGMVLDMEGGRLKTTLTGTEVYSIPLQAGFTTDSLNNALRVKGWNPVDYAAETGYSLWNREKHFILVYLEKSKKETNFYVAACVTPPVTNAIPDTPANGGAPIPGMQPKPVTSSILGTWIKTSSVHYSYENPLSLTTAGYVSCQYTLETNGTYTYYAKHVSNASVEILLIREHGNYSISGNRLAIYPKASTVESWSRKNNTDQYGTLLRKQQGRLESVTYTFTEHYFSGIQEWNLVLQAEKPTDREGPFSSNNTFSNAWYFRRPAVNSTPVDLPEKQ